MQPIQINVQVNIGLNSELFALLTSVMNRPAQVAELPAAPRNRKPEKPQPEPKPEVTNQPDPNDGQATAAPKEPAEEAKPEPAAPEPQPAQPDPATKEYTEVDVRAAMESVRRRIEGEDYKTNTQSESYQKWHKALTNWFKTTAITYGSDKPSTIPDSESRKAFIAACERVYVKDGSLMEDCPY